MALAEWVAKGAAPFDLWPVDIRRFGKVHQSTDWVRERTLEAYGKHYTIAWPSEEHRSARPTRRSPLYAHLKVAGACFGEKLGWERPNWFADLAAGEVAQDRYSYQRPGWWDAVRREHQAARKAAVLIDQTSFAKFTLQGPDAASALNWIASGNVDRAVGSLTYTQMLNSRGGIECDLTVAQLSDDLFYIVTGTGFRTHDMAWIADHIKPGLDARLTDVTESWGTLSLMGPKARDILAKRGIAIDYLRIKAFPFTKEVEGFMASHEKIFVVEQNRDAQLRSLLTLETDVPKSKLHSILHYDGLPMTSKGIVEAVLAELGDARRAAVSA